MVDYRNEDERIPPTPEAYPYVYGRWPRLRRWALRKLLHVGHGVALMAAQELDRAYAAGAGPALTVGGIADEMWGIAAEIFQLLDNPWTLDYRHDPPRRVKHDEEE